MIEEGIKNGVYVITEYRTLGDHKLFRDFLYCNFKKYEYNEKTKRCYKSQINQDNCMEMLKHTIQQYCRYCNRQSNNLKFRLIIAQSGTCACNAIQVIDNNLKPLCSNNKYIVRSTQKFAKIKREQDSLKSNEEYVYVL